MIIILHGVSPDGEKLMSNKTKSLVLFPPGNIFVIKVAIARCALPRFHFAFHPLFCAHLLFPVRRQPTELSRVEQTIKSRAYSVFIV